jgi:cytochrome P450
MILLKEINEDNDDFVMSIERYSCSVVSIIGWGRRIKLKTDPIVERALAMMHQAAQIFVPGDYWVETIPELRFLPSWIYAFPTQVRTGRQMMAKYWYALTKEGAENSPGECFSSYLLKNAGDVLSLEEVGGLTGNLIGGGVDTTTSTMLSFILACVAFPEAFVEVRKELDRVVGQDRLPDWSDEAQMPSCRAMIREVLRWRSVAVLGGIPHAPTRDDEYRGYFIPAGTSIMVRSRLYPHFLIRLGQHLGNSPTPKGVSRARCVPSRSLSRRE